MTAPRLHRYAPSVAALLVTSFALACPAAAADFEIDALKLNVGPLVVSASKIAVKGSPLDRAAFMALADGGSDSAAARLKQLNATEITAAELVYEFTFGAEKQVTRYRDVRLGDIREGRIGRGETPSGTFESSGGTYPSKGVIGQSNGENIDLRQMARVFTERAAPGSNEPMTVIVGRFEQASQSLDLGTIGKMSMGRSSMRDVSAKVGATPLSQVLGEISDKARALEKSGAAPKDKPDAAEIETSKRVGLSVLSLFDSVDLGSGEMRDFTLSGIVPPDVEQPKSGAAPQRIEVKISRIANGDFAPGKSGYVVEGLQFAGGGAKGLIDSISYSGYSFSSMVKALQEDLAKPLADLDAIEWRRYVPTIGTIRLTGLSVDAPPMLPSSQPIKIALGTFELKAGEQLNGIPTSLALTIDKLVAPITEGTGNPAARDMIAMGIRSLDLSAKLDLAWDAVRNELAIRQISFGGEGLARLNLSGTLGNVTKDLFASDIALAQVAALGATARGLNARLENFGLVEKLIANEARKAGRKPEELRQQFAMIASLGLASILGPSDAAKTLTAAVARFAAKPGTLTVEASAKSASGLGLADVIAITDPTEILDKIDLKAQAQ